MVARRIGDAAVPGPQDVQNTNQVASSVAAILAIQKLEGQLGAMHLAPSGLRDAAIQIISEGIDEIDANDPKAYDSYFEKARLKWLCELGKRY